MVDGPSRVEIASEKRVSLQALTPRERQVLQSTADGLTNNESAQRLGISRKTVETHLGHIGAKGYPANLRETITGLIRDGITSGALTHQLAEVPIQPLTTRENQVLELLLQGKKGREIGEDVYYSKTRVGKILADVRRKLYTKDNLHTIARVAYLKAHNMWSISKPSTPLSASEVLVSLQEPTPKS